MIEAEKLVKYYGDRTAVRDMTFQVGQGEIVGLLGPNGAGKTTTMRMLTGYLPIDGGKATVAGYNVADKPMEVRKRLGYLPETVPLYTEMPVQAYLDFTAKIRGVPGKGRKRRVEEVMELCRIGDVREKVIGKLSRGYKQRVGLAQAIIHNPQVIILDEPTVGLDPRQIIEIRKVIRDLAGNHSLVLSTHILPEVSALCDRVVIVNRGRVLVEDTLANLERRGAASERLRLEVRGPQEEVRQFLQGQSGVSEVAETSQDVSFYTEEPEAEQKEVQPAGAYRFDLQVTPGQDVREGLAAAVIRQGWGLLELRTIAPTLEEIFVRVINEDNAQFVGEEEEAEAEQFAQQSLRRDNDDELDEAEEVAQNDGEVLSGTSRKAAPSFLSSSNNSESSQEESGDK